MHQQHVHHPKTLRMENSRIPISIDQVFQEIDLSDDHEQIKAILESNPELHDLSESTRLIVGSLKRILPDEGSNTQASDLLVSTKNQGLLRSFKSRWQFLIHTQGPRPCAIIDFATILDSNESLFLYNRCQENDVSERLLGCMVEFSLDGNK